MDHHAREKDRLSGRVSPEAEEDDPAGLQHFERDESERVVHEVGGDEERHHQTAREAQVAGDPETSQPCREGDGGGGGRSGGGGFGHEAPAGRVGRRTSPLLAVAASGIVVRDRFIQRILRYFVLDPKSASGRGRNGIEGGLAGRLGGPGAGARSGSGGVSEVRTGIISRRGVKGARAAGAPRITLAGYGRQAFLDTKLMLPAADHVVDVAEPGVPAKPKIQQRDIDRRAA